jgi:hypothetical protein
MLLDKEKDFRNMVKGIWLDEVNNQQEEK